MSRRDWRHLPDGSIPTSGTTSPEEESALISFAELNGALAKHNADVTPRLSDPADRRYPVEATELLAKAEKRIADGDAEGAFLAGYELGKHVEDWRVKDSIEAMLERARRNVASLKAATLAAADERAEQALHGKGREWAREVDARRKGLSKASAYLRIAEREGVKAGAVKQTILRYQKRASLRK